MTSVKTSRPKFKALMSLVDARATLIAGVRSVKSGGWTQRAGMIAREVCGAKFGTYKPSEIMEFMRKQEFQERFKESLDRWVKGWDPAVSPSTQQMRENQNKACLAFIADNGWNRLADAVESMLAARAPQVVMEDNAGNRRVQVLVDVLDLFFGIRMTAARSAAMRVVGTSK